MAEDDKSGFASIKFTQTKVVDDERKGTDQEERYEAGKTYKMSLRSADRWVKRGVAEWASPEDQAKAAGAASDVAGRMQDADRYDPTATRIPPVGTGTATDGEKDGEGEGAGDKNYDEMTKAQLLDAAKARPGLSPTAGASKSDLQKMLERDDKVSAALEAGEYDTLHVDELQAYAERENVEVPAGTNTKAEWIEVVSKHRGPKTA